MELKDLITHRLMGKTIGLLSHALDYRAQNHGVISGNLSNIDTPNYKPKELVFDEALRQAVEENTLHLKKTHERHLERPATGMLGEETSFTLRDQKTETKGPVEVDLDKEMAKMTENNLLYEATVRLLSKKFEALKIAIEERRR